MLTRENLVKMLDDSLFGWAYRDIERASIYGEAKLGGFILGACFIDAMAGFLDGIDKEKAKSRSGVRFKDFVRKYLPQYDPEKLWTDLRCGLVSTYINKRIYV